MKKTPIFTAMTLVLMALAAFMACSSSTPSAEDGNGIYYWRTTMSLSDAERDFLDRHKVGKMYVRFFDVGLPGSLATGESVVPNATISFNDSVPEGAEIVPTVYITTSAIEEMQLKEEEYAEKILKRIDAICRKNGIAYNEIQFDCDWTKGTRDTFFNLCKAAKAEMDSTKQLSSTIRLHQLTQAPPPVDKGVLMVYNTGNLMDMATDNSIFSVKDIEPYLRDNRLGNYGLPLDVAYPAYGWSVVYRPEGDGYKFGNLMQITDFSGYPEIEKIGDNLYEATGSVNLLPEKDPYADIFAGYRIRVERPSAREILKVKAMIEKQLKGKPHSNILYHLDENQLSHFSNNEIDKIYSSN